MKFIARSVCSLDRSIDRSVVSRKLANRTLTTLLESLNSHSGSRVAVPKVKGLESGFIVQLYQKHAITGLLFETRKSERERETSKGIRPLRLSGIVVGRVILQMFDRKPALGRLQTCFCNVEPRISVSRGIVFFFPPFPYREGQSKLSAASLRHKIRQGRITSH